MLPIRDHNPSGRRPFVTYTLIVINVLIFLAFNLSMGDGRELNLFFYDWGMVPVQISAGQDYYSLELADCDHWRIGCDCRCDGWLFVAFP